MEYYTIKKLLNNNIPSSATTLKGWVRNRRNSKNLLFISMNDGSTLENLQIICDHELISEKDLKNITTGASIEVYGDIKESIGKGQNIEMIALKISVIGEASTESYPLQPKNILWNF